MTPNAQPAIGHRRRPNLAQVVIGDISDRIRRGLLRPGDRLSTEIAVMADYGVSRTVVREAISHLQAAGMVETRHGVGTFVRAQAGSGMDSIITVLDVLDVLELRISMETEAASLAAARRSEQDVRDLGAALAQMQRGMADGSEAVEADTRFHRLIAQATGNRHFCDILDQLGESMIPRSRVDTPGLAQAGRADYLDRVNREHDAIFTAIVRRDPDAARAAMRIHLSNSRERLRQTSEQIS
jgi:DNA-binding FadR family transcriptional regulator